MSLSVAHIDAMLAAGCTADQIGAVVKADIEADEARRQAKRAGNAERQRKFKERKRAVTQDNADNALPSVTPPNEYISNPQPVSNETVLATPKSKRSKGTRLADDFEIPDDWIEWAMKKRGWSRAEAVEEGECFTRYWQAKPGREACKLDWPKTWQNWVVNSRRVGSSRGPPGSFLEQYRSERETTQ